jgi:hypothetical protein
MDMTRLIAIVGRSTGKFGGGHRPNAANSLYESWILALYYDLMSLFSE